MFGKNKEVKVVVKSNFEMVKDMLEESEKYLTKTIADMVSQAGGVTLDDVVDPITSAALKNSLEYYDKIKTQTLGYALVQDQKEKDLQEKLDKQTKMLEELLKRK